MGIIQWLNTYNGVIMGIATVVLVGITGIYVYLTWRLLKTNDTPEIAISLRCHEAHVNAVMLCIENIGTGAARNLQFATNPSSVFGLDIPLEKIGVLGNGIAFFEPGRKIEQLLVIVLGKGKLNELRQTPLEITVAYKDSVNHKHKRAFRLDFGEVEGFSQFGTPPLYEMAKNIKKVQEDLHRIVTGSRKPIILTEPLSEHRRQEFTNSLENRIKHLPKETQEKILQEVNIIVNKREQEVYEKEQNEKTATDTNS
ncbi:MAG: hypothetical protein OXL96_04375 [Candidatus Poribacteria bacterium]|nr:hypothetical protein [Candidatus Poribacteria bacterium]